MSYNNILEETCYNTKIIDSGVKNFSSVITFVALGKLLYFPRSYCLINKVIGDTGDI